MNTNKKIVSTSFYPKAMQQFATENFNIKYLCGGLLAIAFLQVLLVLLVKQGPLVIALDSTGAVAKVETKITDLQINLLRLRNM